MGYDPQARGGGPAQRARGWATATGWTYNPGQNKYILCGVQVSPWGQHRNAMLAAVLRVLLSYSWWAASPELRLEFAKDTIEMGRPNQAGHEVLAEWRPSAQKVVFKNLELATLLSQQEVDELDERLIEQGEDE